MSRLMVAIALSLVLAVLAAPDSGWAQYPPPTGSLTLRAATPNPPRGSVLGISVTARGPTGAAIAGVACTFEILSQPGTDASIDPGPHTTDANGIANTTLAAGSTPGDVVVGANCGNLTSQVLVAVAAAEAAPRLPSTGQGPGAPGPQPWHVAGLVGGLGVLALGLRWAFRGRGGGPA